MSETRRSERESDDSRERSRGRAEGLVLAASLLRDGALLDEAVSLLATLAEEEWLSADRPVEETLSDGDAL
jgi:hypothetical protein